MMLTDRITLSGPSEEDTSPEDILSSSLGVIFPDDITNQHGDASNSVVYTSPKYGHLKLSLADPQGEDNRQLFSHYLWNAGVQLSVLIEGGQDQDQGEESVDEQQRGEGTWDEKGKAPGVNWSVKGETVFELGAGTGLAGIVAKKAGAKEVVLTDYPAEEVLANLRANVQNNLGHDAGDGRCWVEGHEWGKVPDSTSISTSASTSDGASAFTTSRRLSFSRILVADCLWMPWQHANLHRSIAWFLTPHGRAWVVAGFHTGRGKMAGFFDTRALGECGLEVERIWERDAAGREREWLPDRGVEDVTERKRWLVIALLRRRAVP